jgi:hypothetical protein
VEKLRKISKVSFAAGVALRESRSARNEGEGEGAEENLMTMLNRNNQLLTEIRNAIYAMNCGSEGDAQGEEGQPSAAVLK